MIKLHPAVLNSGEFRTHSQLVILVGVHWLWKLNFNWLPYPDLMNILSKFCVIKVRDLVCFNLCDVQTLSEIGDITPWICQSYGHSIRGVSVFPCHQILGCQVIWPNEGASCRIECQVELQAAWYFGFDWIFCRHRVWNRISLWQFPGFYRAYLQRYRWVQCRLELRRQVFIEDHFGTIGSIRTLQSINERDVDFYIRLPNQLFRVRARRVLVSYIARTILLIPIQSDRYVWFDLFA